MNRIYRTLFNRRTGTWQAVPEFTKRRGRASSHRATALAALSTALGALTLPFRLTLLPSLLALALTLHASPAQADCEWTGGTGSWFDADKWTSRGGTCSGIPTSSDWVEISRSDADIVISGGQAYDNSFHFRSGRVVILDGGSLDSDSSYHLVGQTRDGQAELIISGTGSAWNVRGEAWVGRGSTGTIRLTDGGLLNFTHGDDLVLGDAPPSQQASRGTLVIGADAGADAVAPGRVQTPLIEMGRGDNGERNATGLIVFNHTDLSGTYTFTPDITGTGGIEHHAGITVLTGSNDYIGATRLEGGTLRAGNAGAFVQNGAYTLNGGILDLNGHDLALSALSGSGGQLILGGAVGRLSQSGDTAYGGEIGGAGRFIKDGPGTLTLEGEVTGLNQGLYVQGGTLTLGGDSGGFAGATTVTGGALRVDGTLGGSLTVEDGATLGGSGTVGDTTIASGGTLLGVQGDTLAFEGNLVLSSGAHVNVQLGAADTMALFDIAGNLALNGTTLNVTDTGDFGAGLYRLFDYGGSLSQSNGGLLFGTTPGGSALSLQYLTSQINLLNADGVTLIFWNANGQAGPGQLGGGSGTWSTTSAVWSDASGRFTGAMQPQPGFAVFGGEAGTVTLDDGDGDIRATGLQFAGDGYRLTGAALHLTDGNEIRVGDGGTGSENWTTTIDSEIAGGEGLTKTGAGTLRLTGANTYTGGTTVQTGTLIGDTGSLRGDIANAGTVVFEQTGDAAFAGNVTGLGETDGTMIKRGAGDLTLNGVSSLDWAVDGGGLITSAGRFTGDIAIGDGASVTFEDTNDTDYNGALTGQGRMIKEGAGTLTLTGEQQIGRLYIGRGTGTPWGEQMDGGTLLLSDSARLTGSYLHLGGVNGRGVLALTGEATRATFSNNALIGDINSDAELRLSDGALLENGNGYLGRSPDSRAIAIIQDQGSLWRNTGTLYVGGSGQAGEGELRVENGGRVESGAARIGYGAGAIGNVTVTGSTSHWETQGEIEVGYAGDGTLVIDDGATVTSHVGTSWVTGQIARYYDSAGAVSLRNDGSWVNDGAVIVGGYDGADGHLTLSSGGRLQTGVTSSDWDFVRLADSTASSGTLNIGAAATEQAVSAGTLESARAEFGDGIATLNFNHSEDNYVFAAALASTGSGAHRINHYAGTTMLTGESSAFTGITQIKGGTLKVNGTLGGTVTVDNGGALGGDGSIGDTTVAAGGTLAPGNSLGHLTVDGDLTLAQGSLLDFEFGAPGGDFHTLGQSDSVTVNGDLTLNGSTLNLIDDGGFGVGLYRLFDYSGTLTQNNGGLLLADEPQGMSLQFLDDQGQINLLNTVGMTLNFWSGNNADGGDGAWSNTTASWTDADGEVVAPMQPQPGFAVFGNIGNGEGGTVTLDDTDGDVQATGLQFAGDGYVLQGDTLTLTDGDGEIRVGDGSGDSTDYTATLNSVIAGTDGVNKTGAGTLVLGGDNTYSGGTTLNGGVLSVASDANLGNTDGGLTFNGGVLRVTDGQFLSTQRSITWGDQGGGFDIVGTQQQFFVNQDLAGAGDLIKRGEGLLHLRGDNDYGNTLVEAGRLFGTATSIRGDLANAGNVVFEQDTDGTFTGNISGFDGTDGTLIKNGGGVLTLTGSSTLDWSVHDGALVTAAERFNGDLAVFADGGVTFDQQQDGEYQGQLSGTGTLLKTGDGHLQLNGGNGGFGGTTEVAAGRLSVSGRLGGQVLVDNGGTLGGDGIVGDTTIAAGGTLAPGNSIGTLTVDGDLTFENGAIYEVETDPDNTDSDLTHVTGTASLSGSVLHVGNDGDYQPFTEYTILSADGGILDQFEAVRSRFAFLDAGLDYGTNDVRLELTRNDVTFDSVALTRNQRSVAGAVESLAPDHAVYQDIVTQETGAAPAAFDRYSGDSLVAGLSATDRLIGQFGDRLRQRDQGETASREQRTLTGDEANGVWLQAGALDSEEKRNGYTGNAGHEMTGEHLTLGLDRTLPTGRVGVAVGRAQGRLDFDRRQAGGDLDGWFVGAYGRRDLTGTLYLRADLSYGETSQDHKRTFESGTQARSSSTIKAIRVALESGLNLSAGRADVRPYAQVAMTRLERSGFQEAGAGAASLEVERTTLQLGEAELGVDLGRTFRSDRHPTRLHGGLALVQPFGDTQSEQDSRFVDAGDTFTVYGADRNDPRLQARLGAAVRLSPRVELSLDYQGRVDDQGDEHLGQLGISVHW
ncbi:autotransporter-associated beta strand repeat-containing protein [Alcanivorax sp. 24]|uniref:autotransporter outer membrane beta-barrel domain-containing protein n=1 Tax=Alcanivorax sp. 24 TaxID=2545266 RepID=UPI00105B8652|nr:autotransporter-associated beta strand repeat-containing protein [Alcanivorax sp. 24]